MSQWEKKFWKNCVCYKSAPCELLKTYKKWYILCGKQMVNIIWNNFKVTSFCRRLMCVSKKKHLIWKPIINLGYYILIAILFVHNACMCKDYLIQQYQRQVYEYEPEPHTLHLSKSQAGFAINSDSYIDGRLSWLQGPSQIPHSDFWGLYHFLWGGIDLFFPTSTYAGESVGTNSLKSNHERKKRTLRLEVQSSRISLTPEIRIYYKICHWTISSWSLDDPPRKII